MHDQNKNTEALPLSVIAIDGPSGSGKSTLAKKLAESLGVTYIDTGAMFRAVACYARDLDIDKNEDWRTSEKFHSALLGADFIYRKNVANNSKLEILIDGKDYVPFIREHEVSTLASKVSQVPFVREKLLQVQRELVTDQVCVMEGRDIGTVVFPNAFLKLYVTASVDVRAQRRKDQLLEKTGEDYPLEKIKEDIEQRDQRDSGRELAPMACPEDAIKIDSSDLNEQEMLELMTSYVLKAAKKDSIALP